MHFERFDPLAAGELARACHEMYLAGHPADDPHEPPLPLRSFTALLALGWTEDPREVWLARHDSGRPGGWYALSLPERENRHLAGLQLLVEPASRRQGAGMALVRHAARRASAQGRRQLTFEFPCGTPADAFAGALGAQPGIAEVVRLLRVDTIPPGQVARLRAEAAAAATGYAIVSWQGRVPAGEVTAVARLFEEANDAPRDAGQEGQRWDAGRIQQWEARLAAQGVRYHSVAARSDQTGELAALTQLGVDPELPGWGMQDLTVVGRAHRGHRLGLLVKAAMLELLADREPQLTRIVTGNADVNKYMIAINEQLGFTELGQWRSWELATTCALARPAEPGRRSQS